MIKPPAVTGNRIQVTVDELRLKNFRAFENARLRFSDLTFLVGRNGAGKSSILDAVDLLREALAGSLETALDRRGGVAKVRRMTPGSETETALGLAIVMRLTFAAGKSLTALYGFELIGAPNGMGSHIRECLKLAPSATGSFNREDDLFEADYNKGVSPPPGNLVLPLAGRADELWSAVLDTIRNLRAYELSPAHMAVAPEIGERTVLARDGSNLGDVLKSLEGLPDRHWIATRLGAVTDGIVDVGTAALLGRRVLRFVQRSAGANVDLDANQVSQGTLRALGFLVALRQYPAPSLLLVDEIENSVHPGALSVLVDAALSSSDRMRVVLTSHSPELLSHPAVTGERVRVIQWRDGASKVYCLNRETQAAVNEIDTVGWMLSSNALWTRPEPETFAGDLLALDDHTS